MGEASRRGTYEQRKAQAIKRNNKEADEWAEHRRLNPPKFNPKLAALWGLAAPYLNSLDPKDPPMD